MLHKKLSNRPSYARYVKVRWKSRQTGQDSQQYHHTRQTMIFNVKTMQPPKVNSFQLLELKNSESTSGDFE